VRFLLVPCVFLLALLLRALPLPIVFSGRGILPGNLSDEFYHLRRIWYSVVRFPEVLSFDPYVNFPNGGHVVWPPGFDWLVAALARLLVDTADQAAVETVAVWVPPVLGALTAVAAARVAGRAFGGVGGAVAGLAFAILPASWMFSQLGRVDHHVAVALAGAVLLGVAMAWLRAGAREGRGLHPGLSVALGLALGVPLLVWPGFLLHVVVAQTAVILGALGAADRAAARRRAWSLAAAHGVAAAVVLPFCLGPPLEQYGSWSPLVLSRFQPAWLGGGAAALAGAAALWSRTPAGASRPRRIPAAAALGLAGVGAALALAPGLYEALLAASGWFTQAGEVRPVAELQPLTWTIASSLYSYAFFLFPLAWVAVAARALRARAPDHALLLLWALVFLVLALEQRRFSNSFAVPYALVWGGAAAHALSSLRRRLADRPGPRVAIAAAAALGLGVALVPAVRFYAVQGKRSLAAHERPERALGSRDARWRLWLGAARWLARSTPPTRGYLNASARPAYGILSAWGAGHLMRYVAERPLVQDNFGAYGGRENFERAWSYYAATDEASAVELLEHLRVRYVVADRAGAGTDPGTYSPRSMTHRLAELFGSAASVPDEAQGRRVDVPALAHHRLVYHARSHPGATLRAPAPQRAVAVYERVRGARVVGRGAPDARIEARLRITTQAGPRYLPRASEPHLYRTHTRADASGRYELTLPYPTDVPFSDAVRVVGAYELQSGARTARLVVSESAVRAGASVAGPSLTP